MTTQATLDALLSQGYQAMVMGKGTLAEVLSAYNTAAAADANLAPLAQTTYSSMATDTRQRDFISKTHAEFLRRALGL